MDFINGGSVRCLVVTAMFMLLVYFPCAIESSTVKEYKFPKCGNVLDCFRIQRKNTTFDDYTFLNQESPTFSSGKNSGCYLLRLRVNSIIGISIIFLSIIVFNPEMEISKLQIECQR